MTDLRLTLFRDLHASVKKERTLAPREAIEFIARPTAPTKDGLPLLSFGAFGETRNGKGCLRYDTNVLEAWGVAGDYDGEQVSFDEAVQRATAAGLECIVYTTASHAPDAPRWRVLAPAASPVPPGGFAALSDKLNGVFGGVLAGETWTLSQGFYFGKADNAVEFHIEAIEGRPLDELDVAPIAKQTRPRKGASRDIAALPAKWRDLIRTGNATEYDGDRSRALAAVAKVLALRGLSDADIEAILLNPDYGIGAHAREQADPQRAVARVIELARRVEPEIADLNRNHALVLIGDKAAMLREFISPEGRPSFGLMTVDAFKQWLLPRRIWREDAKGTPVPVPLAKYWLEHPDRRQYEGITFLPGGDVPGYYNLWRGFTVEPAPGCCELFLQHLRQNVCGNDDEAYGWLLAWLARLFQNPARKPGTAVVLRGKMGTGKTKVGEVIGSLLGEHYALVSDPRYITGRFNSHLTACLLLHCDEAFWAGDQSAEGKLKDLVTGDVHFVEFKGKEAIRVRNYVSLLVSGNPDWLVPAGMEERRFAVFDMGESRMEDHAYFAAIDAEMDNGGREALLHHLLRLDIGGVNLRKVPRTAALLDQKIASLNPEDAWLLDLLRGGTLPFGCEERDCCPAEALVDNYIRHAGRHSKKRKANETALGLFLKKALPGLRKRRNVEFQGYGGLVTFGTVYCFPALGECRRCFDARIQQPIDWLEDESGELDFEPWRTASDTVAGRGW